MQSQYQRALDEEVAKHTTICDDYSVLETNHEQEVNELQAQVDAATREKEQLACKTAQLIEANAVLLVEKGDLVSSAEALLRDKERLLQEQGTLQRHLEMAKESLTTAQQEGERALRRAGEDRRNADMTCIVLR